MTVGVVATLLMATIDRGDWMYAALVFMVANIGIAALTIPEARKALAEVMSETAASDRITSGKSLLMEDQ